MAIYNATLSPAANFSKGIGFLDFRAFSIWTANKTDRFCARDQPGPLKMEHLFHLIALFIATYIYIPLARASDSSTSDCSHGSNPPNSWEYLSGSGPSTRLSSNFGPPSPYPIPGDSESQLSELRENLRLLSVQGYSFDGIVGWQSFPQYDMSYFENLVRECIQGYVIEGKTFVFDPLILAQGFIPRLDNDDLTVLGDLMMGVPLPRLSSYGAALRKWYCYILFGRIIRGSDNPCGQLSFSEFSTLLVEPAGYEEETAREIGWGIARSVLDDSNIMKKILLFKQKPAPVTLTFLPADLQFKLTKLFIPLLSNRELKLWTLEVAKFSGPIQTFRLLLESCTSKLQFDQLVKLTSLLTMQIHHPPPLTIPGFDPDWHCGPYCDFYRVIIKSLPEAFSELKGARSIYLPPTAIFRDFTLPSLFSAGTQWKHDPKYHPTSGFNADFVRELDFVASATSFCRAQFESDSEYKERVLYISGLIRATVPEQLKDYPSNIWSVTVPWLVFNNAYNLLDVFLENWTNGIPLEPKFVSWTLILVTWLGADLEAHIGHHLLAIVQLLKYSSQSRNDLGTFPSTTRALLQLHASIGSAVEPCVKVGKKSTMQFLVPPLMSMALDLDAIVLLRAYLLFQFDISLQEVGRQTGSDASIDVNGFAKVLNVLLDQHCGLEQLQPAFLIRVSSS
jgi:hypothetical protein